MRGGSWRKKKKSATRRYEKRIYGGPVIAGRALTLFLILSFILAYAIVEGIRGLVGVPISWRALPPMWIWAGLILWLILDFSQSRRRVFRLFGYRERVMSPLLRSARSSAVLALPLAMLTYWFTFGVSVPEAIENRGELAVITGTGAFAIVGVFYSSFVSSQNSRSQHTFNLIEAVAYSDQCLALDKRLFGHVHRIRSQEGQSPGTPVPPGYIHGDFERAVLEKLNNMEFLALAARVGDIRYKYIPLTMRRQILNDLRVFTYFVRESTGAVRCRRYDGERIWVSQNSTYEHLLWLAYEMESRAGRELPSEVVHPRIDPPDGDDRRRV